MAKLLNRFSQHKVIADTIYGCVKYGIDHKKNQWVVVKENRKQLAGKHVDANGTPMVEDVCNEIDTYSAIQAHDERPPFFVEMLATHEDEENIYLVLEWAPGGDLLQFVNANRNLGRAQHNRELRRELDEQLASAVRRGLESQKSPSHTLEVQTDSTCPKEKSHKRWWSVLFGKSGALRRWRLRAGSSNSSVEESQQKESSNGSTASAASSGSRARANSNSQQSLFGARETPLDWEYRVRVTFRQICEGVKFMHHIGICHRDLSLENVLLDVHGNAKLCDFGQAVAARRDSSGTFDFRVAGRCGKRNYMSPECASNGEFDGRAHDVWCLGVILFLMLTSVLPFSGPKRASEVYEEGIEALMRRKKVLHLISVDALNLLDRIFRPEAERCSLDDVVNHPFCQQLFTQHRSSFDG